MNDLEYYAVKHYCTTACALKKSLCKREKVDFDLTPDWYEDRLLNGCEISGLPFEWATGGHSLYNPSVDRVDPTKGYVQENCKLILRGINMLKMNGSMEDVYIIANSILTKRNK